MDVNGFLLVTSQVSPELEEEFNRWYDTEHIPERQAIEGFLTTRRFRALDGLNPKYLATCDLTSLDVLESDAYKWLRTGGRTQWALSMLERVDNLTRYICRPVEPVDHTALPLTPYVMLLIGHCAAESAATFGEWFDAVHAPAMRTVPGVRLIRRFEIPSSPETVIAVYDLEDPSVRDTQVYLDQLAASGAWRFFHYLDNSTCKVYAQI